MYHLQRNLSKVKKMMINKTFLHNFLIIFCISLLKDNINRVIFLSLSIYSKY